jgi:hypothetical protein
MLLNMKIHILVKIKVLAVSLIPEELQLGKSLAASTAQAGLDFAQLKYFEKLFRALPFTRNLLLPEEEAVQQAADKLVDSYKAGTLKATPIGTVKDAAKGAAFEVPQEIAQTAVERWQAGLSLTDAEAKSEYIEAGAGAVLLGGGLGGASGFVSTRDQKRRAEEAIREKRFAEEKAKKEAAEKLAAEKGEETPAEKLEKELRPAAAVSDEVLMNAERAIREIGDEVKVSDHVNKLVEDLGVSVKEAKVLMKKLRENKVVSSKDGKFKVNPPEVDVLPYVGKEGETDLVETTEPTVTQVAAAQAQQAQATDAAAAPQVTAPETAGTVETTTAAPTTTPTTEGEIADESVAGISTEPVDTGAVAGGTDVSPSGLTTAGPDLADTERAGLGGAPLLSDESVAGEEASQPPLKKETRKTRLAAAKTEVAERKEQRRVQLNEITTNLNNLRTILPEQADEDTVADLLNLTARLERATEALGKLPVNKTKK